MTPPQRGGFGAPLMRRMNLDIDRAMAAARVAEGDMKVSAIFLPTQQNQSWRVQLRSGFAGRHTADTFGNFEVRLEFFERALGDF